MGIGRRLEYALTFKNMKVSDLAKIIGVIPQRIYNIIKRDTRNVDNELLDQIARALDLPLTYFTSFSVAGNSHNTDLNRLHYIDYDAAVNFKGNSIEKQKMQFPRKYDILRHYFGMLNVEGKDEAIKRVAELAQLEIYKNRLNGGKK